MHASCSPCQEQGRLAGGIPTTNDDHVAAATEPRLHLAGRVVNRGALELGQPRDVEATVFDTSRDNDRPRTDHGAVTSHDAAVAALDPQPDGGLRDGE